MYRFVWMWFAGLNALLMQTVYAAEATVDLRAQKIGANSYYVQGQSGPATAANQGFMSNAGFVVTPDGVVVFDALDKLLALQPRAMVPGHGAVSVDPGGDLTLTRDYLRYLRSSMGKAVADFMPFDEAYAATDWRPWENLPAFDAANRPNAFNTYLLMEQEALRK